MSRTLAAMLALTLGFPAVAMVAVVLSNGSNPALLATLLTGAVVMTFVVAAIFEIRRIAGLDAPLAAEGPEDLIVPHPVEDRVATQPVPIAAEAERILTKPEAAAAEATPVSVNAAPVDDAPAEIFVPAETAAGVRVYDAPEPAPILVQPAEEDDADTLTQDAKAKSSRSRRPQADEADPAPADVPFVATKSKRKGGQSKRPNKG